MVLHHLRYNRKSEAGSLSRILGGEERFKDLILNFRVEESLFPSFQSFI